MPAPTFQTEIDALRAALASGELTIEQNGERVTYRSAADIREAIAYFEGQAGKAGIGGGSRTTLASYGGF